MKTLLIALATFITLFQFSQAKEPWNIEGYMYCVAYTYDYKQDPRGQSIIFKDGSLNKGVIRSSTLRLRESQVISLLESVNTTKKGQGESDCHDPHHAFVFYDIGWKPIAWIEACFLCGTIDSKPDGLPDEVDMERLKRFCHRIGMPVFPDDEGYTRLYLQEQQAEQAGAGQAATSSDSKSEGSEKPQLEPEQRSR